MVQKRIGIRKNKSKKHFLKKLLRFSNGVKRSPFCGLNFNQKNYLHGKTCMPPLFKQLPQIQTGV